MVLLRSNLDELPRGCHVQYPSDGLTSLPSPLVASRGHASENPDLPSALAERNIRFLGPGSVAMAALGDKVGEEPVIRVCGHGSTGGQGG